MAKKTKLYAVKVLDNSGSGSYAGVIAGIDFVAQDAATRNCPKGSVANMSLGGGKNQAVNDAVSQPGRPLSYFEGGYIVFLFNKNTNIVLGRRCRSFRRFLRHRRWQQQWQRRQLLPCI